MLFGCCGSVTGFGGYFRRIIYHNVYNAFAYYILVFAKSRSVFWKTVTGAPIGIFKSRSVGCQNARSTGSEARGSIHTGAQDATRGHSEPYSCSHSKSVESFPQGACNSFYLLFAKTNIYQCISYYTKIIWKFSSSIFTILAINLTSRTTRVEFDPRIYFIL